MIVRSQRTMSPEAEQSEMYRTASTQSVLEQKKGAYSFRQAEYAPC
jgi:hypothetical protein